jgi:outer membrane receptor protein involved in Fe transport
VYENPRHSLDLSLSQRIFSSVSLKASVKNLLNSRFEAVYFYTGSKQETPYRTYNIGRSLTLSMNYMVL